MVKLDIKIEGRKKSSNGKDCKFFHKWVAYKFGFGFTYEICSKCNKRRFSSFDDIEMTKEDSLSRIKEWYEHIGE